MQIFLGIVGLIMSFVIVKKRESLGDMFGEPEWATKIGGIYNVMIIVAALLFFWSLSAITDTQKVLFAPIYSFFSFGKGDSSGPPANFIN
jgi:uncharacterized membrane protein YdcZ (DUF606 family)